MPVSTVTVTTDSAGAATKLVAIHGTILCIQYDKTDYDNGVDFTITTETTLQTVWDEDDVNADKTVCPRQATHSTAGVAATYDGTRAVLDYVYADFENLKIVIGSGGNAKSGVFRIFTSG